MSVAAFHDRAPDGRIAFVLPGLGAGGSERVVSSLANKWAEKAGDVAIITFEPPSAVPYYWIDPRVELIQLGIGAMPSPRWRAYLQTGKRVNALRQTFKRLKPQVIVSFLTKTNVMTVLGAARLNIPVIVSERNNPEAQLFDSVWNWARRLTYPHAFGLVTMTDGARRFFPPHMRKRSWVIPNPVNLPDDWTPHRGRHIVTAVGRLVDQKGFDLLLEAFGQIAPRFPKWTLTIWGEGPDRTKLVDLSEQLGLRDRVRLPGVTEKPGIWIETADIFVLSSRYEGWGIVLLEAMAAGLPVVSFDCEWGPRDMITHGVDGLLVPALDVNGLADALARLMVNEALRSSLGVQAAQSAAAFTPDRISARWREAVQAAIDAGGGAPAGRIDQDGKFLS